ncbi:hypothetical protein INT46_000846, partial [Mucor plumbeus]
MSKTFEINIKKLQDPTGPKQDYHIQSKPNWCTGTALTDKSTGRPSAFNDYTQRHLERTIRRDPFQTLETITGYYTPAAKPKMNEEHKKNRLEWAHLHKNWSSEQWRQVIWSDESRFRVSGNDGTPLVLRKEGE